MTKTYTIQVRVSDGVINEGIARDHTRFAHRLQQALDEAWPGAPMGSLDVRSIVEGTQVLWPVPDRT
jgi:hypothetical protein